MSATPVDKRGTSRELSFSLPWPPTVNTYWRSVVLPRKNKQTGRSKPSSVVLLSEDGRKYRDNARAAILSQRVPSNSLSGKLSVTIIANPPDRRARDLDNLLKGLLDALKTNAVIRDDADIDDLRIVRGPVKPGGAISISLAEIPGEATETRQSVR